jgi:hypothetical protein
VDQWVVRNSWTEERSSGMLLHSRLTIDTN